MKKSLNYDDITQFIKKLPIFFLKLTVNLSPNDRPAEGGWIVDAKPPPPPDGWTGVARRRSIFGRKYFQQHKGNRRESNAKVITY